MTAPKTKTITKFKPIASVAEVLGDRYTPAMQAAFPDVLPPYGAPFGYLCLLQLRLPLTVSRGGIIIPELEQDNERYRTQAALVRAIGSQAFHDRATGEPWVEGSWYGPGDFIRSPQYGGDRFDIDLGTGDKRVTFVLIKDADGIAPVTGDPLTIKTS